MVFCEAKVKVPTTEMRKTCNGMYISPYDRSPVQNRGHFFLKLCELIVTGDELLPNNSLALWVNSYLEIIFSE